MKVIDIKDLGKKYKDFLAVDNVSFSIEEGEIYGLLGPNGAGKSTIINIICGVIKPTYGEVDILGKNIKIKDKKLQRQIGLIPQNIAVYYNYTVYENIRFFASLYGLRGKDLEKAINYALEFTGLLDVKKKLAKDLAGGVLRRLNIACGIVHKPKIIIMDEPTVGIDPQSRNHILEAIKELNKNGTTIIYTTHYMEEAEELCSKIAIVDHGKIIVEGTKEEIKNMVSDKTTLILKLEELKDINKEELKSINGVEDIKIDEDEVTVISLKEVNNLDKIICYFSEKKIKIKDIGYKNINLETVFLALTGRNLRS